MRWVIAASVLLGWSGQAVAQACPLPDGWAKPARHAAAKRPSFRFGLKPDQSAQLDLLVQRSVVLATKEGKQGWADRYAGLAALDVERAGKLDVLLSSRAYVDLVRDGATLKSVEHSRGTCGGVFKIVTFDVQPGRHAVQITGSQAKSVRVGFRMR